MVKVPTRATNALRRRTRAFGKDRRGVSAVEFALILPLMVTLYLGGIQISDALTVSRKVTHVASTLGDLVTQSKNITNSDMSNIFDASAAILAPYAASTLKMKVSSIKIDSNGKATVVWSDARNDTPLTKDAVVTLPAGVTVNSTWIVTAEVHYPYQPWIGYVLTGTYDLHDQFYLRARLSDDVKRSAS
ncbi:pilus assembly protein [soil metagenome]